MAKLKRLIGKKAMYIHKGIPTECIFKVLDAKSYSSSDGYYVDMIITKVDSRWGLKVGTKYHLDYKYVRECFRLLK